MENYDGPKGIGGWLLLPTIQTLLWPLQSLPLLFVPTSSFDRTVGVIMFCASLFGLYLLFKKKALYPYWFIGQCGLVLVWVIGMSLIPTIYYNRPFNFEPTIAVLVGIVLFAAYLFRSKRVKNTFVN